MENINLNLNDFRIQETFCKKKEADPTKVDIIHLIFSDMPVHLANAYMRIKNKLQEALNKVPEE